MAIKELKKFGTYKDGDHDWILSVVDVNGKKTVGLRRWKTRGEGYIGPTKMGINAPPKTIKKMIDDGSLLKAVEAASEGEEEKKAKKNGKKNKNGKTKVKKSSKKEAAKE